MALQRQDTVIPYTSRLFCFLAGQGTVSRRLRMKFRFPIIIIDEDYRSENTSGLGIRALAQAIEIGRAHV